MAESIDHLRAQCSRMLGTHGNRSTADLLAEIPLDLGVDRYGAGGAVEALERQTCELLGKPAAVFMPSGTMAQQIALRLHADRRNLQAIGFHPTSHLELHEDKAYQWLHGLIAEPIGDARQLISIEHLRQVTQPLAAVLFELPQREIGGQLPPWDDLVEQTTFVREQGAAVHLDGARLWECTPHYRKSLAEIAALFDSIYVSFYKGLGGLAGCCLVGDEELIALARVWRHRHGGALPALWPLAASAIGGLRMRLPKMQDYYEHALAIAEALKPVADVRVVPDPPHTNMMHLLLRTTADYVVETARSFAETESLWTWGGSFPSDDPNVRALELNVGDATLELKPEEVADIVMRFIPHA